MLNYVGEVGDAGSPSDFSNIFLTALYVHVELWACVFHTNSNCQITTGAVDYVN